MPPEDASSRPSALAALEEEARKLEKEERRALRKTRELWDKTVESDDALFTKSMKSEDRERVSAVRRRDRPKLASWTAQGHFDRWSTELKPELLRRPLSSSLPKRHVDFLRHETFKRAYEDPLLPVTLDGVADAWPAREAWSFSNLNDRLKDAELKVGEDDETESPLRMKFTTFIRYMRENQDDSPLYVFDSTFAHRAPVIFSEYAVCSTIFSEDLLALVGEKRRPPNKWFLVGPERSGTTLHVDPLGTSAWNTLIRGRKLWVLFPPCAPRAMVKGRSLMRPGEDDEAVDYFCRLLPRILESEAFAAYTPKDPRHDKCVLFLQLPGETCFIPNGWHHAVLNLDDTVAVTQNYVSTSNFEQAWVKARSERRKMSRKWRAVLKSTRYDLYRETVRLDERDGYDLDGEIAAKKARGIARRRAKEEEEEEEDSSIE